MAEPWVMNGERSGFYYCINILVANILLTVRKYTSSYAYFSGVKVFPFTTIDPPGIIIAGITKPFRNAKFRVVLFGVFDHSESGSLAVSDLLVQSPSYPPLGVINAS